VCFDATNDAAHQNSTEVGRGNGAEYNIIFKTENLKMVPGTYTVEISGTIARFKNSEKEITYHIAAETGSKVVKKGE
jgi:hypothetical protein